MPTKEHPSTRSPDAGQRPSTAPARFRGYTWLRFPAIALITIGVAGILMRTIDGLEGNASVKWPPLLYSIIITVLASVLMAIALFGKGRRRANESEFEQDNWRSI